MNDYQKKLETLSPAITLYRNFGENFISHYINRISGDIDSPYVGFLKFTNGASILDYCFFGIKNKKLGDKSIYDEILNLWLCDNSLVFRFWAFACIEGNEFYGYINHKNERGSHYIGFYNASQPEDIYIISSSFEIFMNSFLELVSEELQINKDAICIDNDLFIDPDINKLKVKDPELYQYIKNQDYSFKYDLSKDFFIS